jgi:hypothetical protein
VSISEYRMNADRVDTPAGSIWFRWPDRIGLTSVRSNDLEVQGLARSDRVAVYAVEDWVCVVGLEGPEVVVAVPSERQIAVVGVLDRLDFGSGYEPGGLHRVEFHELKDVGVFIEYEFGVARLDAVGRWMWHCVHGDLTYRVRSLTGECLTLEDGYDAIRYRTSDGEIQV